MNSEQLIKELTFKAVRSSGAGGQHVNKVSSKVVLFFNLNDSNGLSVDEKNRLLVSLSNKLNQEQTIILSCGETRSQHKNKAILITRFLDLIQSGLKIPKTRKATKVPKAIIKKRLDNKKLQSVKKMHRKKPDLE